MGVGGIEGSSDRNVKAGVLMGANEGEGGKWGSWVGSGGRK